MVCMLSHACSHCLESVHEAVGVCIEDRLEDRIGCLAVCHQKPREMHLLQSVRACGREVCSRRSKESIDYQ